MSTFLLCLALKLFNSNLSRSKLCFCSPGTTLTSLGCRPSVTRTWVPTWRSSRACTPTSSIACRPYTRSTHTLSSTRMRWEGHCRCFQKQKQNCGKTGINMWILYVDENRDFCIKISNSEQQTAQYDLTLFHPPQYVLPSLYLFMLIILDSSIIWILALCYNLCYISIMKQPVGLLVSCDSHVWKEWLCFESKIQHAVTSTDLSAFLSSDLVGVGAGRAGEETETEEQAGAGHRHNGPEQLRTNQHLHLLLLFTPPLHLSLPLAPLTQQTKLQPPTIRQTNCKRTEAVYCKTGGCSAEMGGPVYAYMCMCVCLFAAPVLCVGWCLCERLGHRTFSHMHTWRNMSTDSIWLLWMLVFVVCLILISGVLSWWRDGQERNNEAWKGNSIYGIISRMDQSVMSQWREAL